MFNKNSLSVFWTPLVFFFGTEVPGRDRLGPVPQTTIVSWSAPQLNIRTSHSIAAGCMLTFRPKLSPAHLASLHREEGLWSFEDETLDHPSHPQRGERTAWKDDRHYAAAVQQCSSAHFILHFSLEPLAVQTLLVVLAIDDIKGSFWWCTQNARHFFLALNVYGLFVFFFPFVSSCSKLC